MKFNHSGFVNKDEVESVGKLPPGNAHPLRKIFRTMEVGKPFKIDRRDWNWIGKTPQVIVKQVSKEQTKKFEFSLAADDSGWFIERLE